jgi:membrane-associated phospholipid phosphatase
VMAYAAIPTFLILYADAVLGLGVGVASILTAGFAALTGVGIVVGGRQPPERVSPMLLGGTALLGAGLVAAAPAGSLAAAAVPFAAAAVGAGLVTALGFPYFARFIPSGEEGRYSGLYFASRAIASAVALPVAGFTIAATGSYRALLLQGFAAVAALVPLARAGRGREATASEAPLRARPACVAAVIPCLGAGRLHAVVEATRPQVDRVIVVDDGTPPETAARIESLRALPGVHLLRLDANGGKGDAVAAGVAEALAGPDEPDAVIVLDADGQHPPDRIPAFVSAAERADIVIGDRTGDHGPMPLVRRCTNFASSRLLGLLLRRRLPDSQCGMRLYRVEALRRCPPAPGRYEAETLHLRAAVKDDLSLAWIPIPAIYDAHSESSFRPVADTLRVLRAIFGRRSPPGSRLRLPNEEFARTWGRRLVAVLAGSLAVAALVPVLAPLDNRLFFAIHALGHGPEWVYSVLDPHMRNYVILGALVLAAAAVTRVRPLIAVAVTLLFAAYFSNGLLQLFYEVYDRPRPEEMLGGLFATAQGRSWAHIESFPSGHMVITTAVAVAGASLVPALRGVLALYLGMVALTRITFGAHFPLDVVVGAVFGYEVGRLSAALAFATRLLETRPARVLPRLRRPELRPAPAKGAPGEP